MFKNLFDCAENTSTLAQTIRIIVGGNELSLTINERLVMCAHKHTYITFCTSVINLAKFYRPSKTCVKDVNP